MAHQNIDPRTLTASDVERIVDAQQSLDQEAVVVRPNKDNSGIGGMDDVLRSLPRADIQSGGFFGSETNASTPFSFEMRYTADPFGASDERVVSMQYIGGDSEMTALLDRQVGDKYSDSRTKRRPATWLQPEEGQAMAVATFGLRRYSLYPLKNVELDDFSRDPTGSIIREMVGDDADDGSDADVALQVMMRPAGNDWQAGVPNGFGLAEEYGDGYATAEEKVTNPVSTRNLRWQLKETKTVTKPVLPTKFGELIKNWHHLFGDTFEYDPTKADKQAAKMLSDLDGRGWEFHIRVVAVSDDAALAQKRAESVASMMDNYYEYRGRQTFVAIPETGEDAVSTAEAAAGRMWPTDPPQRMIKPQIEVAGLSNIPKAEDVSTSKLRWSLAKPGEGVPPGTPRFDFTGYGISPDAPRKVKQLVMMETSSLGDPYWYGWGAENGKVAGVFDRHLNAHQFFPGRTRMGKTVSLTNFSGQAMRRFPGGRRDILSLLAGALDNPEEVLTDEGLEVATDPEKSMQEDLLDEDDGAEESGDKEGGLIVDPKGQDGDDFVAEWPEDRPEEDLIVVDLDDEYENIPRFNMLSIPSTVEPGSRTFSSYTNAVADVATMMVAEAGGSDNYVGSVMKRVTRTLARGMLKSGRDCTFLDLAACASYEGDFEKFSQWMNEERLAFIGQAAQRMAEDDNIDLNPLAGRFDEYVQVDSIRAMISAREPTFDIQEAVDEGKWIVLLFPQYAGETEITTVTNSYVAETYMGKMLSDNEAPFHFVGDEVHNFTTSESMLPHILSQGGGLGYRCTLACQSPANQLPTGTGTGGVRGAVQDNIDIWNSFKIPGNSSSYVSSQYRDIEASDLEDLSRYTTYLVQYTEDNEDIGTMVDTFPPIREVREEVLGEAARTDEEVQALKRRSMERYGEPLPTPEEQQAQSPFFGEVDDVDDVDAEPEVSDGSDEDHERTLCKAVYDSALRAEDDGLAWTDADAVRERLERYADDEWTVAQFGALADRTSEIEYRDNADGNEELRCSEDAREQFLPAGDNQTEGGLSHRGLLRDAYDPLVRLGLEVEIPEQGGGAETDGIGHIRETFAPGVDPWSEPAAFAEELEMFREEHPELAALTDAQNVTIEAESSTSSKPAATCENLVKAVAQDKLCLFLTRPEKAQKVFKTLSAPPYLNSSPGDADRQFYNRKRLAVGGERVLRPAGAERTVWREYDGEIVLEDNEGREHARFDSPEAVFEDRSSYPAHTGMDDVDDDDIGRGETWRPVAKPWIPEREFGGPVPGNDAWRLVVVERDGTLRRFETNEVLLDEGDGESEEQEPEKRDQTKGGDTNKEADGETDSTDEDDPWAHLSRSNAEGDA